MATKAQVEAENARLVGKLATAVQEIGKLQDRINRLENDTSATIPPVRSCINCGQETHAVIATDEGYECPQCGNKWTDEHEQAAFRRGKWLRLQ